MSHNDNHGRFREKLHAIQPPCVPFIGIYLKDLTFIDAGVKDYLLKTNDDPTADPGFETRFILLTLHSDSHNCSFQST